MNVGKSLTSSGYAALSHPPRSTLKSQEVTALCELAEDLETSIAINMQLMQDIVSHSSEDSTSSLLFPAKVCEKLIQQVRKLERAVQQTKAQMSLCLLKVARSEQEAVSAQRSEEQSAEEINRMIETARKVVAEKEATIQSLEDTFGRLEAESEDYQHSHPLTLDLPGAALRVSRLTRTVKQDEQLTQQEKSEAFEHCKVSTM